jgi:hypothetical protein
MSVCSSFPVHKVAISSARQPAADAQALTAAVSSLGVPVACYVPDSDVPAVAFLKDPNQLASAVYNAFYQHYPLKLNPNVIWLTIVQGFGKYVNKNAEALRDKFVSHQGKAQITVARPDFVYGSPSNDWPSVFPQFADGIEKQTNPGIRELLESRFSNSTATDLVCSHIGLMDVCQQYFDYDMACGCGIPRIDLLGTVDDWRLLRRKAEGLKQFEPKSPTRESGVLSVWLAALLPALDQFVSAAEGHPDVAFWGSVCNLCGLSGMIGDPVTGWITVLFPYVGNAELWRRCFEKAKTVGTEAALANAVCARDACPWLDKVPAVITGGCQLNDFPLGLSRAPVRMKWLDVGKEQDLLFYGGIFAVHQHPDGALEPRTGWAVVEPRPGWAVVEPRELW